MADCTCSSESSPCAAKRADTYESERLKGGPSRSSCNLEGDEQINAAIGEEREDVVAVALTHGRLDGDERRPIPDGLEAAGVGAGQGEEVPHENLKAAAAYAWAIN